ncbi:MAG: response regulator, partial [Oligoflexia bacterium]|nr:response regulator [Oligoflexia bacterium]
MSTILIIDDEKLLRDRLKQLFEMEDYTVFTAEDGISGLKILETEKPEVVILDVKMPGIDGVEVLKRIKDKDNCKDKGKKKNIEVIMVTGHASMETVVEILRLGAYDYVQKPVTFEELEIIVKRAIQKQQVEKELLESQIAKREWKIKHDTVLESETRYKMLFDNFSIGVLILGMEEKHYTYANGAVCEMLDYTPQELSEMDIMSIYPKDEHERIKKELLLLEEGHKKTAEDIPCLKKDNTIIYVDMNSKNIRINDKLYQINILKDITLSKQLSQEKEEMQKQITISSRLASLGEMSSGIAHEINNPLYIISLNLETLEGEFSKSEINKNPIISEAFKALTTSTERITKIINGLRSYTHFDESMDKMDINDVINASVNILKSMYAKEFIVFEMNLHASNPTILGNWGLFQQIMMNFFSNSKYAMKNMSKGKINIITKVISDLVVIEISDSGCGIPEDKIYKIFDPFFTTKPIGEGSGIGLNLVHSIVNKMHGHIKVDSKIGVGTTFTITFPTYEKAQLLEEDNTATNIIKSQEKKGMALIVDDEKDIRGLIS